MKMRKFMSITLFIAGSLMMHVQAAEIDTLAVALETIKPVKIETEKKDELKGGKEPISDKQKDMIKQGGDEAVKSWKKLSDDQKDRITKADVISDFVQAVKDKKIDAFVQAVKDDKIDDFIKVPAVSKKVGCEEEEKFLAKEGKKFAEDTEAVRKTFARDVWDTLFKSTSYSVKRRPPQTDLSRIKGKAGVSISGRFSIDEETRIKLQKVLSSFDKVFPVDITKSDMSNEEKAELRKHLAFIVMLDLSLLPNVVGFVKEHKLSESGYDLVIELYELNIGYVESILSVLKKGKLSGGNKTDLDFAINYINAAKDFIDAAGLVYGSGSTASKEDKQKAQDFVKSMDGLNKYLQALLCKQREILEQHGYDFKLIKRMADPEQNRLWHHPEATKIIDASWDRYRGEDFEAGEGTWELIDKKEPFYRHYWVELDEVSEIIDDYKRGKSSGDIPQSMQEGRKQFVISSINKFAEYMERSKDKGVIKTWQGVCEACFIEDLYGNTRGGERFNDDQSKSLSTSVDANLNKALNFLNGFSDQASKDAGNNVGSITKYKNEQKNNMFRLDRNK